MNNHFKTLCLVLLFFVFVLAACTATDSSTPTPFTTITVNIDELVKLAETNSVAADSYKGKWVSADGYVSDVSKSAISVAGLNALSSPFGIESALSGFECKYGSDMESQVAELRVGDRITLTGKLTRWYTFLFYEATIESCEFTVKQSNSSTIGQSNTSVTSSSAESDSGTNIPPDLLYEGCDGLMELISTIPTDGMGKMQLMGLALSGNLEICNSAINSLTAQMDSPSSADSNVDHSDRPNAAPKSSVADSSSSTVGQSVLPDLRFNWVGRSPDSVALGSEMTWNFEFQNDGYGNVNQESVVVALRLSDGTVLDELVMQTADLPPGGQVQGSLSTTIDDNQHIYELVIDPSNAINETSEGNNVYGLLSATQLLQTNLRIGSISTTSAPIHNDPLEWNVEVFNDGPGYGAFTLILDAIDQNGNVDNSVSGGYHELSSQNSKDLSFPDYTVKSGWTYKFKISGHEKPDLNDGDNVKTVDINKLILPDLRFNWVGRSPDSVALGSEMTWNFEFQNDGYGNVNQESVVVALRLSDGTVLDELVMQTADLPPGGQVQGSLSTTIDDNQHIYELVIDPSNAINETSEGNNVYGLLSATQLLQTNLRIGSISTTSAPIHNDPLEWNVEVFNDGPGYGAFTLILDAIDQNGNVDNSVSGGYHELSSQNSKDLSFPDYTVKSGWTYKFKISGHEKPDLNDGDNVKTVDIFG
ncbi:hypothetical protein FIL92_00155 [SAR202 cluster bacterium AD-812-D07_MRT_10900m]|nr:hypothetical protein [SAR202 cluster bacterium AD-812-D07_MRT_10900m]